MKQKIAVLLFSIVYLIPSLAYSEIPDRLFKLAWDKNLVSCQMWYELIPYLHDLQDFEIRNWFNTLNSFKQIKTKKDCEKFDDSVRWVQFSSQDLIINNPSLNSYFKESFNSLGSVYTAEKLDQKSFRARLEFLLAIRGLFDPEFKELNESLTKFFKDNPIASQNPVDRYQAFRAAAEVQTLRIFFNAERSELPLGEQRKFINEEKARVGLSLALHQNNPGRLEIYRNMKASDFIATYSSELFWKLANRFFPQLYILAELSIQEFNAFLHKPKYQERIIGAYLATSKFLNDFSVNINTDPEQLKKLAQDPDSPENELNIRTVAAGVQVLAKSEDLFWSSGSSSFVYHWLKHAERTKAAGSSVNFFDKLTEPGTFFERVFATIVNPTQIFFRAPRDVGGSSKMLGSLFFCAPNEQHPGKLKRAIVNFVMLDHSFTFEGVSVKIKYAPVLATYQEDLSSCL